MGIETRQHIARSPDAKQSEPVVTQQATQDEAMRKPGLRPTKTSRPMKSKLYLSILFLFSVAIVIGFSGMGKATSGPSQSPSKWDYEVFSFNLEVTHENGYGHAMKFNVSTSQFDGTTKHIEENGWEYVGVVHVAGELANNFTYVLFRKPQQ